MTRLAGASKRPRASKASASKPRAQHSLTAKADARHAQMTKVDDSDDFDTTASESQSTQTMFSHMFSRGGLADKRRRANSLVDVVSERQANGPLQRHRVLYSFAFVYIYWSFVLPALASFGSGRWHREVSSGQLMPRAGGPWAEVSWVYALLGTIGYLSSVFMSVRLMERCPPMKARVFEVMLVYNLTQMVLNLALSIGLFREARRAGFQLWGNALEASEESHALGRLLWFHYHCCQLELVDTIFIIVRKKFQRMSYMHLCIRLLQMWGWFFTCRFACGGDSYFPAAVNSMCKVVVYFYYTVSLVHDRGVPLPLLRRAWTTEAQVLQFFVCAVHAVYVLIRGNVPRSIAALELCVMVSSLILYVDHDSSALQSRVEGRNTKVSKPESKSLGGKPPVTFCFDACGWLYAYHFGVAIWMQEHVMPKGLTTEKAATDLFPEGLKFSGSSGGALVATALATGIDARNLFEHVMTTHARCQRNPFNLYDAVWQALEKFLPNNAASSMLGRVRVLLTRVSPWPPFVTGEVIDHFDNYQEALDTLRATCHVPGLNFFPFRLQRATGTRAYFDGLLWSSLLVPWQSTEDSFVVKVSATGKPLSDIKSPFSPPWWSFMPPDVDVLRGMMWAGYRDADTWFREAPSAGDLCGCRAAGRRQPLQPTLPADAKVPGDDRLKSDRVKKHAAAKEMLLCAPTDGGAPLPALDPVTGESVSEMLKCYERASEETWRIVTQVYLVGVVVAITLGAYVLPLRF